MKTNDISPFTKTESTYALLVRSEERSRSIFESAVYLLVVLSSILTIWQFIDQPVPLPVSVVQAHTAPSAIVQQS